MLNVNLEKNSLNNFISHLSWLKKLSPAHGFEGMCMSREKFLKPWQVTDKIIEWIFSQFTFNILWVTLTQKIITHRVSKIHEYTSPQNHSWIFESLWVIIFWVRVTCKMLNVNWEKIYSIILSDTCHGLRNFPLLIHIPSYPFMNFW